MKRGWTMFAGGLDSADIVQQIGVAGKAPRDPAREGFQDYLETCATNV